MTGKHHDDGSGWDWTATAVLPDAEPTPEPDPPPYGYTHAQWDKRLAVGQRKGEIAADYFAAHLHLPHDLLKRNVLRFLGFDQAAAQVLDNGGTPLFAAIANRPAVVPDRTQPCPHGCGRYVRLDRHIKRQHRTAK